MMFFITGGERSGKSSYAESLALNLSSSPIYLATARRWDENFRERIQKHIKDRDDCWTTIEEDKYLSRLDLEHKVVVVDCLTLWLTNWYSDYQDVKKCLKECKEELHAFLQKSLSKSVVLIFISNEIGMGLHAHTKVGREFTELQGWINQYIAEKADEAILMVSGIPVVIKKKGKNV